MKAYIEVRSAGEVEEHVDPAERLDREVDDRLDRQSADDCAALFEVLAGRALDRDAKVGTLALVADLTLDTHMLSEALHEKV